MQKHTQTAAGLFPISGEPVNLKVIRALILIKKVSAQNHGQLDLIKPEVAQNIVNACEELIALSDDTLRPFFPIDVFQTGSGTNTNMNANEVIAEKAEAHPNNEVNYGQSSNDTFPSAIHIAALKALVYELLPVVTNLELALQNKSEKLASVVKTGRTHSMDAMPITFGQELEAWRVSLRDSHDILNQALTGLSQIPLGGTAVGTGINAHAESAKMSTHGLSEILDLNITAHAVPSSRMGSQHTLLNASNALTVLATCLNKIASDLILLNSGPLCGFGDIKLPAHIDGSSIMPGKVNPVIPESACQVYARVMGNHATIIAGTSNSRLQLNVYLPVMGNALLNSIELLTSTTKNLQRDIEGFEVNAAKIKETLQRNPILVTGLNKIIGYDLGKKIVQESLDQNRPLIEVAQEMTNLSLEELETALNPYTLTNQN